MSDELEAMTDWLMARNTKLGVFTGDRATFGELSTEDLSRLMRPGKEGENWRGKDWQWTADVISFFLDGVSPDDVARWLDDHTKKEPPQPIKLEWVRLRFWKTMVTRFSDSRAIVRLRFVAEEPVSRSAETVFIFYIQSWGQTRVEVQAIGWSTGRATLGLLVDGMKRALMRGATEPLDELYEEVLPPIEYRRKLVKELWPQTTSDEELLKILFNKYEIDVSESTVKQDRLSMKLKRKRGRKGGGQLDKLDS